MSTYLAVYGITFGILAVAAVAQAVSGFGFVLVAVPLLALSTEAQTAVVTASMVSLGMTAVTFVVERQHVSWAAARDLTLASVAGMPFGLLVLHLLSSTALTSVIAVVTLGCTFLVWRGLRVSAGPWRVRLAGAASGLLLTATGTNGPPLVATLQAMGLAPRAFRATIAAVFTGSGVAGAVGFTATGAMTTRALTLIAIGLPAAALGGWAGNRVFASIDAARFRRIVLAALVLSSSAALTRAALGIL